MRQGTLALSWGRYGGFYIQRGYCPRLCLGRVALTYVQIELDDLMDAYADPKYPADAAQSEHPTRRT